MQLIDGARSSAKCQADSCQSETKGGTDQGVACTQRITARYLMAYRSYKPTRIYGLTKYERRSRCPSYAIKWKRCCNHTQCKDFHFSPLINPTTNSWVILPTQILRVEKVLPPCRRKRYPEQATHFFRQDRDVLT